MELRYVNSSKLFNNVEIIEDNITVAQFLQSLDNDNNSSNGLQITEITKETLLENSIQLLPTSESELENIVEILKSSDIEFGGDFVSQNIAEEHLDEGKIEDIIIEVDSKKETESEDINKTDKVDTIKVVENIKEEDIKTETEDVDIYQIEPILDSDKERFLEEINSARATSRSCGSAGEFLAVEPLVWSTQLYNASYEHNYDMKNSHIFSHDGSGTKYDITGLSLNRASNSFDRIMYSGYLDNSNNYGIGENIAAGEHTIEEVVKDWLESDGHCVNIMRGDFKEMAISKVPAESGYYWTNEFGYR